MNRKIKILGLALFAVLAMSAAVGSAASAATFKSEASPTDLTGSQIGENEFIVNGQAVKCKKASFTGSIVGTSVENATVTPAYSECTYGAITVHVTIDGCTFTLSANGPVTVNCPAGAKITILFTALDGAGTNCTLTVGAQTPEGGATYTNEGAGTTRDIKVTAAVKGIATTADPSGEPQTKCKALAVGKAKYEGSVTVKGYVGGSAHSEANHRGIFRE